MEHGASYEDAYRYTQKLAFQAVETDVSYRILLSTNPVNGNVLDETASQMLGDERLDACFDAYEYIKNGINHIIPDGPSRPPFAT